MRDLVYYIAVTVDGFIAREDGSFADFPWDEDFVSDLLKSYPETFPASFHSSGFDRSDNQRFDAVLMGRRTYEVGLREGVTNPYPTLDQYVVSRSMEESPDPSVTLITWDVAEAVAGLKQADGRAIWICGGSELATALLDVGLIDRLIIKLNPIVFGNGIPLFARQTKTLPLSLEKSRTYESGHVLLDYRVKVREIGPGED